jgi:hypothetical protein
MGHGRSIPSSGADVSEARAQKWTAGAQQSLSHRNCVIRRSHHNLGLCKSPAWILAQDSESLHSPGRLLWRGPPQAKEEGRCQARLGRHNIMDSCFFERLSAEPQANSPNKNRPCRVPKPLSTAARPAEQDSSEQSGSCRRTGFLAHPTCHEDNPKFVGYDARRHRCLSNEGFGFAHSSGGSFALQSCQQKISTP